MPAQASGFSRSFVRSPSFAPRFLTNNQINLVIQPIQAANQALDRKLAHAAINKLGHVRLLQSEQGGGLGLGQLAAFDDLVDFTNEFGLEKLLLRIGEPENGKDIPLLMVTLLIFIPHAASVTARISR